MMTVVPIMRAAPAWSPSPFQAPRALPPAPARPTLAQTVITVPTTPPGVPVIYTNLAPPSFIDSALVGAVLAGVGAASYGILTAGAYFGNLKKSTLVFGIMTVLLGGKAIGDLYEVRFR